MSQTDPDILNKLEEINHRLHEVESGLAAIGGMIAQDAIANREIALDCYLPASESAASIPATAAEKLVLIVEDDPSSQLIYRHILQNLGYGIVSVCDGKEAVQVYQTLKPNLVIMDIGLPTLDGFRTSRALRSLEFSKGLQKVPIICVTGSQGDKEEMLAKQCGMDGYLLKPIDIAAFQSLVTKWCA